jgi:anion-transporting  ArsA/GET3 family ATPase
VVKTVALRGLVDPRFVVVAGKGGVGRTTLAAALALLGARHGRRVLICQTRARDGLAAMLGVAAVGERIEPAGENLWAVNMDPRAALREYGTMMLRFPAVYRAVFENRPLRAFLRAVPGLYEFAMLGKACYHAREQAGGRRRFDTVILDGPATGHLVQMLRLPRSILGAIASGPLAHAAREANELLRDPAQTIVHLVTLAEEMPVAETLDLCRALRDEAGVPLGRLVVNALWPDRWRPDGTAARVLDGIEGAALPADLDAVVAAARAARARRALQEHYVARLTAELPLPQIRLPMLFAPVLGRAEALELMRLIEAQA